MYQLSKLYEHVVVLTCNGYSPMYPHSAGKIPDNVKIYANLPYDLQTTDFIDRYKQALLGDILPTGSAHIFTHDLLFQESFLPIAKAIHELGEIQAFEWHHVIHSGLPKERPINQIERCTVPKNHHVIVLNANDLRMAAAYYQTENVTVWNNEVAFTDIYLFSDKGRQLAESIPADCDVVTVLPADAGRLKDKGLDIIINIHNALQDIGLKTCLLVIDAYNVRPDYMEQRSDWWKQYNNENGKMIFMSTDIGENTLSRSDVFGLLAMADVFILPSVSESSSLIIQEAALAKNLLVLNTSVPQMAEQIPHDMALYYAFGGVRYAQRNIDYKQIANDIHSKIVNNDIIKVKQRISAHNTPLPI